jgi:hypothetical protein
MGSAEETDFLYVLEMKGLSRKAEQQPLLEAFRQQKGRDAAAAGPAGAGAGAGVGAAAGAAAGAGTGAGSGSTGGTATQATARQARVLVDAAAQGFKKLNLLMRKAPK